MTAEPDALDRLRADLTAEEIAAELAAAPTWALAIVDREWRVDGAEALYAVRTLTSGLDERVHVADHGARASTTPRRGAILGISRFFGKRRAQGRH